MNSKVNTKLCTKLEVAWKRYLIVFGGHLSNFKATQTDWQNRRFWPEMGFFRLFLQFDFTDGYELMHKAFSGIEAVGCHLSRSSVKFQGHMGLIINDFDPNWAFPDCFTNLTSQMVTIWCTKLEVTQKRCTLFCAEICKITQGHMGQKSMILITRPVAAIKSRRFALLTAVFSSDPSDSV